MRPYEYLTLDSANDNFQVAEVAALTRPKTKISGLFDVPAESMCGYSHWTKDGHAGGAAIVVPDALVADLPSPDSDLRIERIANDHYFFYPDASEEQIGDVIKRRARQARDVSPEAGAPSEKAPQITIEEAAALIMKTHVDDPRSILFYTGAGISNAQHGGVWTYQRFAEHVGFAQYSYGDAPAINRQFMSRFLTSEQYRWHCLSSLDIFIDQLRGSEPTVAHFAFTGIIKALGSRPLVATTNIDGLHEAAGIEVPTINRSNRGGPTARHKHQRWFDTVLQHRAPFIRLVVAIGRSNDDRNVLNYIAQKNPAMRALSVNMGAQKLTHARSQDFILNGDCQNTLPALGQAIGRRMPSVNRVKS